MAGSDLDGDEYTVIWDPGLALERSQPPADYATPKVEPGEQSGERGADECQAKMAEFFCKYLCSDMVGRIANSHLANADLYGIDSEVGRRQLTKRRSSHLFDPSLCWGDK